MSKPSAHRPAAALRPNPAVVVIDGPIDIAQVSVLCEDARVILAETNPTLVVCDVSALAGGDMWTVDALARLALVARRLGCQVQVRHATTELRELFALAGLADVVPCYPRSGGEPSG